MTTHRYADSFHKKVRPPAGERCSLKWHYTGVMRELIGFFDEMAAIDPTGERFVYTSIAYIIETAEKNCKRFNGKPYRESSIRHGLAEARARRVISKLVERERWLSSGEKGHQICRLLEGSIVTNHDCVTHFENGECTWVGPMHGCGRWERIVDSESATLIDGEINFDNTPSGVLYWAGCAQHAPATGGLPNGKQMLSAPNLGCCAGQSADAVHSAVHTAVQMTCIPCAEPIASPDSGQVSDVVEVDGQNGDRAVVTVSPVQPKEPEKPTEPAKPFEPARPVEAAKETNDKTKTFLSSSLSPLRGADLTMTTAPKAGAEAMGMGVEKTSAAPGADVTITIGRHFAELSDNNLLDAITDGTLIMNILENEISSSDKAFLVACCEMAVEESAAQPWDGQRTTCARLMNRAAALMTNQGKRWPSGWLKLLKALEKGGQCVVKPQRARPETKAQYAKEVDGYYGDILAVRANLRASGKKYLNNASGWDMCADGYKRDAVGRAADSYTVMASDGVWEKP